MAIPLISHINMSDIQPRLVGKFLKTLNSSRKRIFELPFDEAAKLAKDGETLFESLEDGQLYTAFTDCDHYCQSIEAPSDEYIEEIYEKMMNNLGRLINDQFDHEVHRFGIAIRHGVHVEKKVFKLSWRCYFFGFVITLAEMKQVIVRKGLDKAGIGSLDSSPYNKSQLLGCVGFAKGANDRRVLTPLGDWPLEKFMVQNIKGDETILKYDDIEEAGSEAIDINTMSDEERIFDGLRFVPPWDILESAVMSLDVQKRCKSGTYESWARVGWAIAGVAKAAKRLAEGLELWLRFCQQSMETYLEDPMKARLVYFSKSIYQLGWKSLLEALEEDAPIVHKDIENRLSPSLADKEAFKAIEHFVKVSFRRPARQIDRIVIRTYGSDKYFIVTLGQDSGCDFIEGDHEDGTQNHIVIGLKFARNKCLHMQCKALSSESVSFSQYPENVKSAVQKHLQTIQTPTEIVQKFVRQHQGSSFVNIADEDLELNEPQSVLFGQKYALTRNTYCQVCRCSHDKPENCIFMNQAATLLAMGCRLNPDNFHPPGGIVIPQNITNIIVNQTVNINVNNNGSSECQILESDFAGDRIPLFQSEPHRLSKFIRSFAGEHNDIAWFVHSLWGEEFRYFADKWHCFECHIWNPVKKIPLLRSRLSTSLCEFYKQVQRFYRDHLDLPKAKEKVDLLKRTISNLKIAHFKDSVMKEVVEVFQIENRGFADEVNRADLLPFTNGVLELNTLEFREGRPEDKMTMTTRIPFVPYTKGHPVVAEIKQFVRSIQPDKEAQRYLFKFAALCLTRDTSHQLFTVFTGFGSNGKSIFTDLLASVLGDFAGTQRVELLTHGAGTPHGAQSGVDKMENKRLVLFGEPPKGSTIQAEIIKRFAGGTDKISTRGLHQDEREFVPVFKAVLACNSIPKVSEDSFAVWRRMRIVDFPIKFSSDPEPGDPLSQLADETLPNHLPRWSPYLAGYLVKWICRLRSDGLRPPNAVSQSTNEYRDDNDPYLDFRTSFLEECSNDRWIQWADLLAAFRPWHDRRFSNQKLSEKGKDVQTVKNLFEDKLGRIKKTTKMLGKEKHDIYGFFGWRLKTPFVPGDGD